MTTKIPNTSAVADTYRVKMAQMDLDEARTALIPLRDRLVASGKEAREAADTASAKSLEIETLFDCEGVDGEEIDAQISKLAVMLEKAQALHAEFREVGARYRAELTKATAAMTVLKRIAGEDPAGTQIH